jgi:hypothetical protein
MNGVDKLVRYARKGGSLTLSAAQVGEVFAAMGRLIREKNSMQAILEAIAADPDVASGLPGGVWQAMTDLGFVSEGEEE